MDQNYLHVHNNEKQPLLPNNTILYPINEGSFNDIEVSKNSKIF